MAGGRGRGRVGSTPLLAGRRARRGRRIGLSFLLFNMVIVQVDAGRAAVALNLIPVFGVASAVLFLREDLTARDVFGAVLIGSSVVYFAIADHREATAQAQADGGDAVRQLAAPGGRVT